MKQNVDFELIPADNNWWNIRFLEGPFTESVVQIGNLRVSHNEASMGFDFHVVSTPDDTLSESSEDLQSAVSEVLGSLFDDAVQILDENERKSNDDDS